MVPTFGRGTIRKFSNIMSEMKKLAARVTSRTYCRPVFTADVVSLALWQTYCVLYPLRRPSPGPLQCHGSHIAQSTAKCHAPAKLRVHSESTLNRLESQTEILGRRMLKCRPIADRAAAQQRGPLKRTLNPQTYVRSVRLFRAFDSYSTQPIRAAHVSVCILEYLLSHGENLRTGGSSVCLHLQKKDVITQIATKYRREARPSDESREGRPRTGP